MAKNSRRERKHKNAQNKVHYTKGRDVNTAQELSASASPAVISETARNVDKLTVAAEGALRTQSALIDRLKLSSLAGLQFGGDRDLYKVYGYKVTLTVDDFLAKYARQDITSRIIDAPPAATWSNPPTIVADDAFTKQWDEIIRANRIWNVMERADRLSRLGRFSMILFGFGDNTKGPVKQGKDLFFVKPIGEKMVDEISFVKDAANPRFGQPNEYKVSFDKPASKRLIQGGSQTSGLDQLTIHHSRVVHIVENPLEDDVLGTPIIAKVFNLLDDLLKIAGGTAETYWLTANRGLQVDIDKDMEIDPDDAKELSDAIDEYQHQLRRVLRTRGVKINVLGSETPDPEGPFSVTLSLISGTTGIPKRILLGSEAGQLASEQDRANWAERISERITLHAQPHILEPTIKLLQTAGRLPDVDFDIEWPDAFRLSPLESAQTMASRARAIQNMAAQTKKGNMQITSREEARNIIGLEGDLDEKDLIDTGEDDGGNGDDNDNNATPDEDDNVAQTGTEDNRETPGE